MAKPRYLVFALTAGNIAMVGETTDPNEAVEAVVRRAVKHADPPSDLATSVTGSPSAPICAIHQLPMVLMWSKKRPFWSCHQKNPDGSWCAYQPGEAQPAPTE